MSRPYIIRKNSKRTDLRLDNNDDVPYWVRAITQADIQRWNTGTVVIDTGNRDLDAGFAASSYTSGDRINGGFAGSTHNRIFNGGGAANINPAI